MEYGIYKSMEDCKNQIIQKINDNKLIVRIKHFCSWCNKDHDFELNGLARD